MGHPHQIKPRFADAREAWRGKALAVDPALRLTNRCTLILALRRAWSRARPPGRRAMVSKLVTTEKMTARVGLRVSLWMSLIGAVGMVNIIREVNVFDGCHGP
jgi:hypothetical protein